MEKDNKQDASVEKAAVETIKAAESTTLPKMSYTYSINKSASQTKEAKFTETKTKEAKGSKVNLQDLLGQIKAHPEVLKLLDKAKQKHHQLKNYTAKDFLKSFNTLLAKSLKLIDEGADYIVNKETKKSEERNEVLQKARPPIIFGIWVSIITFGVFGIWAATAPLSSAAGAQGVVIVDSFKKVIQHKEGGIVEAIYVKDGDHVKEGQELIKLSGVEIEEQIKAYEAKIEAAEKQVHLLEEQVESYHKLFEKGLIQKNALVDAQLREASADASLQEYKSHLANLQDHMSRLNITSPIDGIVNQLSVHTIGGVVRAGEPLMFVIPQDDNLIIEGYIDPKDIDSVHVGLKAKINISAFRSRTTAPLTGVVTHVSPDVVELGEHRSAFKVRIEVDKDQLTKISKLRNYELYPGMQAEINIITGERTFLQYLLDPITSTFWHAFNEK